jgi:glucokinase
MERDARALIKKGHPSRVLRIMKKEGRERLTSSVIAKALADGDEVMIEVIERAQHNLGILVSNVVNLVDPEVVVIGGGIAERLGEPFVEPIRRAAQKRSFVQRDLDRVRIVATELKDTAAPRGAAFVARQRLPRVPTAPTVAQALPR